MLTYQCTYILEVVDFSDSDYASCMDEKRSTSSYIFMIAEDTYSFFYYGGRVCGVL